MLDVMQDITFEQFYRTMGFIKYPFRDRTAEKEDTSRLFVKPLDYSRLEDILLMHPAFFYATHSSIFWGYL